MSSIEITGNDLRTSSGLRTWYGILFLSHQTLQRSWKLSHSVRMIRSPVTWKRLSRSSRPHSSSNAIHFFIASRAQSIQTSPSSPGRSPYEERTPRVSSPDVDRALPAPYASTIVTFAPILRRLSAVQPPHAPAPTTTMSGDSPERTNGHARRRRDLRLSARAIRPADQERTGARAGDLQKVTPSDGTVAEVRVFARHRREGELGVIRTRCRRGGVRARNGGD